MVLVMLPKAIYAPVTVVNKRVIANARIMRGRRA